MIRIELSSMAVNEFNYKEKINQFRKIIESNGFEFGFQIHNRTTPQLFERILDLNELSFSFHAPINEPHFLNLCLKDRKEIKKRIEKQLKLGKRINARYLVFHGFYMTEIELPNIPGKTWDSIQKSVPKEFTEKSFPEKSFFESSYFKELFERALSNLELVKDSKPVACVENDAAFVGLGLQRPQEIKKVNVPLCFDLGHFWSSSLIHEFDLYKELKGIAKKLEIHASHLQLNEFTALSPKKEVFDTHNHLYCNPSIDLKKVIEILVEANCNNFVLEILEADKKDLEVLIGILKEKRGD
ncbi:MAG: hypothetical protein ABIE23_01670 [archaeon]